MIRNYNNSKIQIECPTKHELAHAPSPFGEGLGVKLLNRNLSSSVDVYSLLRWLALELLTLQVIPRDSLIRVIR